METTWIVLANASRARIFESVDGRAATEVLTLVHPGSRLKATELSGHPLGHAEKHIGSSGHGSVVFSPRTDPHDKETHAFAQELARQLHEAVSGGRCQALLLAASSAFLGELRAALSDVTRGVVRASDDVDLTELPTLALQHRLAAWLAQHVTSTGPAPD